MGVRTVAEGNALDSSGELILGAVRGRVLLAEVPADGVVVLGGHLKRLQRELAASRLADFAVAALPRLQELGVIARIGEDADALVVLGRGAEESDTADVDFLDRVCERAVWLGDGLSEGVEVADDDGNGRDGLRFQVLLVGGDRTSKDALNRSPLVEIAYPTPLNLHIPPWTAG